MQRNQKIQKIKINGAELKIGVVVAQFNRDITEAMLKGAIATLKGHGVKEKNIKVIRVPGGVEIPLGCQMLAKTEQFDGLVAIGCVIKGETTHDFYVASFANEGILRVSLDYSIPIGFGVITTNDLEQARARSKGTGNKGIDAARAVLSMIEMKKKL
jgi:6,7-dimethyl-8-ribityllumazine synthase